MTPAANCPSIGRGRHNNRPLGFVTTVRRRVGSPPGAGAAVAPCHVSLDVMAPSTFARKASYATPLWQRPTAGTLSTAQADFDRRAVAPWVSVSWWEAMEHGSGSNCREVIASAGELASTPVCDNNLSCLGTAVLLRRESFGGHNKRLKQTPGAVCHRASETTGTRPPLLSHGVVRLFDLSGSPKCCGL